MDNTFFEKSTLYKIYHDKIININIKIIYTYTDIDNNRRFIEKIFEFNNKNYHLIPNSVFDIIRIYPNILNYLNSMNRHIINYNIYNNIKIQVKINKNNDNMSILSDKDFNIDDFYKKLNLININNAKI